jgi:hypothetical protein
MGVLATSVSSTINGRLFIKHNIHITKEELAWLLPHEKVVDSHLKSIRSKILTRCVLIAAIFALRAFVINFYPQYYLCTIYDQRLPGTESIDTLNQFRLALAFVCSVIYLYSFYKNIYFRSANVAALFVFGSLIWSDFEALLLLQSFTQLTYASLGMIFIRLMVGVLLLLNYLDTRNE